MLSFLLQASEAWLLEKLKLTTEQLSLRADAKPPPTAGDLFISLYGVTIGVDDPDLNVGLDVVHGIGITVTKRLRYNPYDTVARQELIADYTTCESYLWKCIGWLHLQFQIPYNANILLHKLAPSSDGFIEPFRFDKADPTPRFVGEEWFRPDMSLANPYRQATFPYAGMTLSGTLGKARRTMTLTSLQTEVRT